MVQDKWKTDRQTVLYVMHGRSVINVYTYRRPWSPGGATTVVIVKLGTRMESSCWLCL